MTIRDSPLYIIWLATSSMSIALSRWGPAESRCLADCIRACFHAPCYRSVIVCPSTLLGWGGSCALACCAWPCHAPYRGVENFGGPTLFVDRPHIEAVFQFWPGRLPALPVRSRPCRCAVSPRRHRPPVPHTQPPGSTSEPRRALMGPYPSAGQDEQGTAFLAWAAGAGPGDSPLSIDLRLDHLQHLRTGQGGRPPAQLQRLGGITRL